MQEAYKGVGFLSVHMAFLEVGAGVGAEAMEFNIEAVRRLTVY